VGVKPNIVVAEVVDAHAACRRQQKWMDASQRDEALASIKAFFVDLASALLGYPKSISKWLSMSPPDLNIDLETSSGLGRQGARTIIDRTIEMVWTTIRRPRVEYMALPYRDENLLEPARLSTVSPTSLQELK